MEVKNKRRVMNNRPFEKFRTSKILLAIFIAVGMTLILVLPAVSSNILDRIKIAGSGNSIYLPLVINQGARKVCFGGAKSIVIAVEPALINGIRTGLSQLEQDICDSGLTVMETNDEFSTPSSLRFFLTGLYSETNHQLKGAILIGNFPHIYQFFVWPTDPPVFIEAASYEYYTDLDGDFTATPEYISPGGHTYSYNQHTGNTQWEIWIGVLPRDTDTQTTIDGLNRYFAKNHAYRNSQLPLSVTYLGVSHEYQAQIESEYSQYMDLMRTGWDSWMPFSNAANSRIYFSSIDPPLSVDQAYEDMKSGSVNFVVQYGHGSWGQTGSITFDWLNINPLKVTFLASGNCDTADPDFDTNIMTRIIYHPNSSVVLAQGATNAPGGRGAETIDGSYGDNISSVLAVGGRIGDAYLEYINKPTYYAPPDDKLGNVLHFVLALEGDPSLVLVR